jgi:hypothetical protein
MMDRFVFHRDEDDGSFPDADAAPMRASSFTSLGDPFTIALLPAAPPAVSRVYVRRPPGPKRADNTSYEIITAHRGLLLLRVTSCSVVPYRQDYFVFKAADTATGFRSRLERLPACTEPLVLTDYKGRETSHKRFFHNSTIGLVSGIGDGEEFAVVELAKFVDISANTQKTGHESSDFEYDQLWCRPASDAKMGAELCVFRSRLSSKYSNDRDGVVAEGNWEILMLPIRYREEELSDLLGWSTDGAITFNDSICWFDYHHGGILSYTPPPLGAPARGGESFISYVQLPIDRRPMNSLPSRYKLEMYRGLCVTGQGGNEQLMFVDVARDDGDFYGQIGNGFIFTITCHTFTPADDHQMWHKDVVITSDKLLRLDEHERLMPRNAVPTFPLVSKDEPHLVHFLMSELREKVDKISVVVIHIITQTVVSVFPYIQGGEEHLHGKDVDMVKYRSRLPWPFLPSWF